MNTEKIYTLKNQSPTTLPNILAVTASNAFTEDNNTQATSTNSPTPTTFKYGQHTYDLPIAQNKEPYLLFDLDLQVESITLRAKIRKKHFIIANDNPVKEVLVSIYPDDISFWTIDHFSTTILLYKAGERLPLAIDSQDTENGTFHLRTKMPLSPGSYFIFFPNAQLHNPKHGMTEVEGGSCCCFELLRDGKDCEEPFFFPTMHEVKWTVKTDTRAWNRGNLQLFIPTILEDCSILNYSVYCYNADLALMAQHTICGHLKMAPVFQLKSHKPWLPGRYTAIIANNREPIVKLLFVIDEEGNICRSWAERVSPKDFYHPLVRDLEFLHNDWWPNLRERMGLSSEKQKIIRLYLQQKARMNQGTTLSNDLLVVTAPNWNIADRLTHHLYPILYGGKKHTQYWNCREEEAIQIAIRFFNDKEDGRDTLIFLYNMEALSPQHPLLSTIHQASKAKNANLTIVLVFNNNQWNNWYKQAPKWITTLPNNRRIHLGEPSKAEQAYLLLDAIQQSELKFNHQMQSIALQKFWQQWETYQLDNWRDYDEWITMGVIPAMRARLNLHSNAPVASYKVTPNDLQMENYWQGLVTTQHHLENELQNEFKQFEAVMKDLHDMVGLQSIKSKLYDLFTLQMFYKRRRTMGLPCTKQAPRHLLFTGNPGTGKTTVARMIGKIYHQLGLLETDEVIVTERGKLVGQHIGQTEDIVNEILERSKGKVLFIDEAYTLCDTRNNRIDFGYRVVESLLTTLADENENRVIILAGYQDEMQQLLDANKGLESRFSYHFHFEDYTREELLQIAERKLAAEQYVLTPEAYSACQKVIEQALAHQSNKKFGNARWVNQWISNQVLPAMAKRVMQNQQNQDKQLFTLILAEDIAQTLDIDQPITKPQRKIGFTA